MNKISVIFLGFFFIARLWGQIVLSEIMYDADTLEYYCEYIEIYNSADYDIDLSGWAIGNVNEVDLLLPLDESTILKSHEYAVIFDPGYWENNLKVYQLPDSNEYLPLLIDDNSFGTYGLSNSIADTILLIDDSGFVVQSYLYMPDNLPGYSEEKIDLTQGNDSGNWGNCLVFRGTPGRKNSIAKEDYNVKLASLSIENDLLQAIIENNGFTTVNEEVELSILNDYGYPDSLIWTEYLDLEILPGDSVKIESEVSVPFSGYWFIKGNLKIEDDLISDNHCNGFLVNEVKRSSAVINELMIAPGEYGEWMEIFNNSSDYLSLYRLKLSDLKDTTELGMMAVKPFSYLVLCENTLTADMMRFNDIEAYEIDWLTLNNDTDFFTLMTDEKEIIDESFYDISAMKLDLPKGVSLERIRPGYSGRDIWNWALCVNVSGHSAGAGNSLYYQPDSVRQKVLRLSNNPFSPDGDGFEDICAITLQSGFGVMKATIQIFALNGRLEREWVFTDIPGNYTVIWDGTDKNGNKMPLGLYIVYAEMLNRDDGKEIKRKATVVIAY